MALGWLESLRRAWASGSETTGRRAQIVRRLHLVNLSRLRGLLVAVVGINAGVLALALVTRGLTREVLGSGPLELALTLHRLVWIVLDLGALALLGRCLASPGPTSRLALVETGVIAANMLMVVSLILPLYAYYSSVSLFYVAVFSLVPLIRLDALRSALAIAAPALILMVGVLVPDVCSPVNISNAVNLAAMAVLALISSRFLFAERLRDLHQREVIARQQAKLVRLALTDELTGLANRRSLTAGLRREWRRAVRENAPLALILLDIDHFKQFNDLHGHVAGDDCLRRVAACLTRHARRAGDMAARYGGEEFVMLLPGLDLVEARELAEAIRIDILGLDLPHPGSPRGRLTVSLGVTVRLERDEAGEDLLTRADGALYVAKAAGRNQVYVADGPTGPSPGEDGQAATDQAG